MALVDPLAVVAPFSAPARPIMAKPASISSLVSPKTEFEVELLEDLFSGDGALEPDADAAVEFELAPDDGLDEDEDPDPDPDEEGKVDLEPDAT